MSRTRLHRAREADLFPRQVIEDGAAVLFQFRVKAAVFRNDRFRHLGKERFVESDLGAEAGSATNDHAGNVVTPTVARDDPIRDEERRRTGMIADDTEGSEIRVHLLFTVTGER